MNRMEKKSKTVIENEQELLEMYNKLFSSTPHTYSLEASAMYHELKTRYKKEEIRTIAEILTVLAKAPSFLDLEFYS